MSIAAPSPPNEKVAQEPNLQFAIVPEQCLVPDKRLKIFDDIYAKSEWAADDLKKMKSPPDFYGDAQWPPKSIRQLSASGHGSYLGKATETSLQVIKDTIVRYNITSMLDIPCGDANWIFDSFLTDSLPVYVGLDIVRPVIEFNKQRFAHHKNKEFYFWDAVSCTLPKFKWKKGETDEAEPFDLVHVRDVITYGYYTGDHVFLQRFQVRR
eukprot:scaffold193_cov157-Skeletonema_menzelii.AAC.13